MLEAVATTFVGWLPIAAMSFGFRRKLGVKSALTVRALRLAGAVLLAVGLARCGTPISGERLVRFLGAASLSGIVLVVLLSVAPARTLRPVTTAVSVTAAVSRSRRQYEARPEG